MAYQLSMRDDDILQLTYIGDLSDKDAEASLEDTMSFLEATTEAEPLPMLIDSSRGGKMSPAFRKTAAEVSRDPRMGKRLLWAPTATSGCWGLFL